MTEIKLAYLRSDN